MTIPKIVHFIYLHGKEEAFSLASYLAVLSAVKVLKPEKVIYHYHTLPAGGWWEKAYPLMELRYWPEFPIRWGVKSITKIAHIADALRMKILYEEGGIYLDLDTISVRPVDDFLSHSAVLGIEEREKSRICNAIMMFEPKHPFLTRWLECYEEHFDPMGWGEASIQLPFKLYHSEFSTDKTIYLAEQDVFFWPSYFEAEKIFEGEVPISPNLRILHLWFTWSQKYLTGLTISQLQTGKTMFSQIVRQNNLLDGISPFEQIYLEKMWGNISDRKTYDGPGSDPDPNQEYIACLKDFLKGHPEIKSYLDIGCGTTRISNEILREFPEISYTGVDICQAVIDENRRIYPKRSF